MEFTTKYYFSNKKEAEAFDPTKLDPDIHSFEKPKLAKEDYPKDRQYMVVAHGTMTDTDEHAVRAKMHQIFDSVDEKKLPAKVEFHLSATSQPKKKDAGL